MKGGEDVQNSSKKYFADLYNVDKKDQFAINMFGFFGAKSKYFIAEQVTRIKVEARVEKCKNCKQQLIIRLLNILMKSRDELLMEFM